MCYWDIESKSMCFACIRACLCMCVFYVCDIHVYVHVCFSVLSGSSSARSKSTSVSPMVTSLHWHPKRCVSINHW